MVLLLNACASPEKKVFCYNNTTQQWEDTAVIKKYNNTASNKIVKAITFPFALAAEAAGYAVFIPVYILSFGNDDITDKYVSFFKKMDRDWQEIDENEYECYGGVMLVTPKNLKINRDLLKSAGNKPI